jgi:hypothetical protein
MLPPLGYVATPFFQGIPRQGIGALAVLIFSLSGALLIAYLILVSTKRGREWLKRFND